MRLGWNLVVFRIPRGVISMDINEYCLHILKSEKLEDKILSPPEGLEDVPKEISKIPEKPGREKKLQFSDEKNKIPRLEHLRTTENRALALHHFANHELMALEIFAYALLKFQNLPSQTRRDLWKTLKEEQNHLRLYVERMNQLGVGFGDRPLNYIFWKFIPLMKTFENFTAIMSLSLEGANLDFSLVYGKTFESFGDTESATIMERIYKDELAHVNRGINAIKLKSQGNSDWEYFLSILPHPFTPRRAKGYFYFPDTRRKVGFSENFIENLGAYKDEFSNRKKERIPNELQTWGIYSD